MQDIQKLFLSSKSLWYWKYWSFISTPIIISLEGQKNLWNIYGNIIGNRRITKDSNQTVPKSLENSTERKISGYIQIQQNKISKHARHQSISQMMNIECCLLASITLVTCPNCYHVQTNNVQSIYTSVSENNVYVQPGIQKNLEISQEIQPNRSLCAFEKEIEKILSGFDIIIAIK